MSVYYKFKNRSDYYSVPTDGPSISVATLKQKILESMRLSNAESKEEYLDATELIPANTSVVVDHVPDEQQPLPISAELQGITVQNNAVQTAPYFGAVRNIMPMAPRPPGYGQNWNVTQPSMQGYLVPYAVRPMQPMYFGFGQLGGFIPGVPFGTQNCRVPVASPPRGSGSGMHRHGFALQQSTPPPNYVCHTCKVPGHFRRDCPTNGDPNYDIRRVESPTGTPNPMLIETADRGSGSGMRSHALQQETPPPDYVCHTCHVPGHFRRDCPTNGDPNYDIRRVESPAGTPNRILIEAIDRALQQKTPPPDYVCHRCKVPGHFRRDCPIRRVEPPTGIPRTMLIEAADGSSALPTGDVAILKPNDEAASKGEIEGLPTTHSISDTDIPPELLCPICKDVMKDAVVTSCCSKTYCHKCLQDYIISKSACFCGKAKIRADDF